MKVKLDLKNKFNKFTTQFKQKKSLRIVSIALVAVLVVGGFLSWYLMSKKTGTKLERVHAQVSRGTVTNVIEGTGTVAAISQYEITSLAKGDVIADYFEVGDYVTKEQLLYEIDSASIDKSITRQKNNVDKAATNYNDALENVANLSVKSTITGVISNMYVSVGDNVQQGAKIADVINKEILEITLPFGKFDAQNIRVGEGASVTLSKSLTTIPATVTRVATGSYVNDYGVEVTDIELEFANPGTISQGESASAVVGNYACYDTAEVSYIATKTITAKTSGEVQIQYKHKGDSVASGEAIVLLESSSVARSRKDAQTSLHDANLSLDDLYDNLEDYSIKSPIDGKVIQKNIKAGEKLDSNSSAAMAIIADLSKLTFEMSIDELDISEISAGQEVTITADALPGQTFTGYVSNISIVGTAYQGVTSYPVTVTIDNTENSALIPGMNVSAQIIVDSAEDVLRIPVSAVQMGNLVIVKDDGSFADPSEMMKTIALQRMAERQKTPRDDSETAKPQNSPEDEKTETVNGKEGTIPQRGERPQGTDMPQKGEMSQNSDVQNSTKIPTDIAAPRPQDKKDTGKANVTSDTNGQDAAKRPSDGNTDDRTADRIKNMIENLDVPAGYTVVMVQTGLTDGTFIEIKEIDGSLKEGDGIILSAVTEAENTNQNGMFPGMGGGMRGGMGGGMPGGGMPGGGMPGAMGGNRSNAGGNRGGMR